MRKGNNVFILYELLLCSIFHNTPHHPPPHHHHHPPHYYYYPHYPLSSPRFLSNCYKSIYNISISFVFFLFCFVFFLFCLLLIKSGDGGHRFHCPFHAKEMLYHLSYIPIPFLSFSNPTSFELYDIN